jgi:hypothetical protein
MGTSLINTKPQDTYPGLLKTTDNAAISGTLKTLSDGNGNDFPMQISTTAVNFTGTLTQNGSPVTTPPSGVSGAIQFSNGSAFASDAANLFWDDTNNRLGVGTNAPSATAHFKGSGSTSATTSLLVQNSAATETFKVNDAGNVFINANAFYGGGVTSNVNSGIKVFNGSDGSLEIVQDWSPGFNSATLGGINLHTNGSIQQRINSKGNVLFGTVTENASAKVLIESTTQGFLPPRMTTTQRNNIASPAAGLMIYNTTTAKLNVYTTAWEAITSL